MEDFEIRYDPNLKTVIISDNFISFDQYWLYTGSSIDSLTYRGITFNPHLESAINIKYCLEMIMTKDYSHVLKRELKFPVILQIYFKDRDSVTEDYIKKNFRKFFDFLCECKDSGYFMGKDLYGASRTDPIETLKKLLETGKFITKRNIKTYIKTADEKENNEFFDILTEYQENL